jgi:hypothetical protein
MAGKYIQVKTTGDFRKTRSKLERLKRLNIHLFLGKYGQAGVDALRAATPVDTGLTAASWEYDVERIGKDGARIVWSNTNTKTGVNVAIILEYGHGTGTGGYVAGHQYITPAIDPVFKKIKAEVWREVIR